jgi:hypothetical protein
MKSKYEDYSVDELRKAFKTLFGSIDPNWDYNEDPQITDEEIAELEEIIAILRVKDPLPPPKHTAKESWAIFKAEHAEEFAKLGQIS